MRSDARLSWLRLAFVLTACLLPGGLARGQDEEEEEANGDESEAAARYVPPVSAFDSWVFQHGESEHSVRARLEAALDLQIDEIGRAGKLTDAGRAKLALAGQGDIQRYFEEVETLRRKFLDLREQVKDGRDRLNEVWKEIEPLRLRLAAGLFREGSIFRKSLRRSVSAEHAARYEQAERERRALSFRARVEWVVAVLDNAMPMQDEQRQGLVRFLLAETRPPVRTGDYDHYVILWQLSMMPEEKLKPLFDEAQWKMLDHQFSQLKGVKEYLERHGWLVLEGEPAAGSSPATTSRSDEK